MSPPSDDPEPPSLKRGFPAAFWIALAFGLICVLAGLALARLGPKLLPAPGQAPAEAAASPLGKPHLPR